MAHMGIVIAKESWAVLREEPLYSARFIDREGAEEMARSIPNVRLHIFERSSHMVFMEEPEELVTVLTEWLTAVGK